MNKNMVRYLLAKLLLIEAALLFVPLIVAFIYQEAQVIIISILATMIILAFFGMIGTISKPKNHHMYTKEALLIVALCWTSWSFFGALPFVFSGQIPNIIDAFFEMSSAFTTTAATTLPDISVLSRSLLFWRAFAHLIGGMGVLVFALAIIENNKNSHLEVMRVETPGPTFGKVASRLKDTAQILYIIYLTMFAIFVFILWFAGLPVYDSFVIAMGIAGTAGCAVYNDSIAHYDSSLITNIVSIGVLLFGIKINLYYFLLLRKVKTFFADEELRTYIGITLISTLLIWLNVGGLFESFSKGLEVSFFEVSNIITTSGFGITDITVWPLFSQVILLLLMFIGGMAGSTSGGFMVIRVVIIGKIIRNQVLSTLYPNRIMSIHINHQPLDKETQNGVLKYLGIYVMFLLGLILILSLDNNDFMIVISAAISTFNNVGMMLGTNDTYDIFSPFSKIVMSFAMIAGRLEIYPMLLLFLPKSWSKV